jgi:ribosomal-protein-alanine N-acetyltransferase
MRRSRSGALIFDRVRSDADLDAVAALEARCFSNPWTREMLAAELRGSSVAHVFLLRQPDGAIAAFCSCWIVLDELHVNTIAVDEPNRRAGVGRSLMKEVLAEAARLGATRATLEVRESNVAARRLYERLGFSVAAVRPNYYTAPVEDALILWLGNLPIPPGSPS